MSVLLKRESQLLHFQDSEGYMPIHHAAESNALEALRFLIENGAEINAQADNGDTPARLTVRTNDIQLLEALYAVAQEIDPEEKEALIEIAERHGSIELIPQLMDF